MYSKMKMGKHGYSPEFVRAARMITLWTLVLRRLRDRQFCARMMLRQKKRAKFKGGTGVIEGEEIILLVKAYENMKAVVLFR